jgi:hypothetical protein
MSREKTPVFDAATRIATAVRTMVGAERDDVIHDIAVFLLERPSLLDMYAAGDVAYVVKAVKNFFCDRGFSSSNLDVPRFCKNDSALVRSQKVAALQNQVSINDEIDGEAVETILPCGKYEAPNLWKKIRSEAILEWISANAPLLDYLLETDKESTPAPRIWNTKSIVRAYAGTEEVRKLLKLFGHALSADEKLFIEENMFRRFMHAKKAPVVEQETYETDVVADFFMAM